MPGNSTTNSFKAKMPRTCGLKTVADSQDTDNQQLFLFD
jgi:hypothetical protein